MVTDNDLGSVVARFPSSALGVFTAQGLSPGSNYTLRASCVDALNTTCVDVVHSWRSAACPPADPPFGLSAVGLAPGKRFVGWAPSAMEMVFSVDGGTWASVPEVYPGTPADGVLVC